MKKVLGIVLCVIMVFSMFSVSVSAVDTEVSDGAVSYSDRIIRGDFDINGVVEDRDAIYLLYNIIFGNDAYPVAQNQDVDLNGIVDADDTILLLYHCLYGDELPLGSSSFYVSTETTWFENVEVITLGQIFSVTDGVVIDNNKLNIDVVTIDGDVVATVSESDNWADTSISFNGTGKIKITVCEDAVYYNALSYEVDIIEIPTVEKFAPAIEQSQKFLIRVGNLNAVALGSLFKQANAENDNISDANVVVTVEEMYEGSGISGTYTTNATWEKATIKLNGTGVAKITITDNDHCIATTIYVEVIDAKNATSVTSATTSDVVLLNNAGFSTVTVSGGYTLHGNGFTITASSDLTGDSMSTSYVELVNGRLDNIRVVCPNFSHQIMYMSQAKVDGNIDPAAEWRYKNIRSAVSMEGNSTISNSYVSGGRAAIFVMGGYATIDNTMVNAGALANIHVGTAQSVTLRDITLVQRPTQANVNDTTKTKMGMSVLVTCGGDGTSTPITLEGTLNQYAWANETYDAYFPDQADSIVEKVLQQNDYKHNFALNENEAAQNWLCLGFAYMPADLGYSVSQPTIIDNRTQADKDSKPYDWVKISAISTDAYVYSYKNTNGTDAALKKVPVYTAPESAAVLLPTLSYNDVKDGITFTKAFDVQKGWVSTLEADLDTLGSYTFNFANLVATKNGEKLNYTVALNSSNVDATKDIALTSSGITDYVLSVTDNDGVTVHQMHFVIVAKQSKIDPPQKNAAPNGEALLVVKSNNSDWSVALPALEGAVIRYWSVAEKAYKDLSLSSLTPSTAGKQNGTNNYWEYTAPNNDFYLKVTCGVIQDSKNIYGMPVVVDNKLYFTISSTDGYVSTNTAARAVTLTYEFKDNNGGEIKFTQSWNCNRSNMIDAGSKQYLYSDFVKGTLKEATSGSGSGSCVTPDTMVTLADGSKVRVDSLTGDELLLVWNMETGKFDYAPIMFIDSDAETECEVITLYFSDGTDVKVISEHGFWDYDLNKYVYLDKNAADYIGHTFAKQNGDTLEKVQLVNVVIETEMTTAWSPVTVGHLCYFVNDMLSMPGGVGGLFNIFDVDAETMTYDYESIAKDIETYGLFTYEEVNAIAPLSEEMFYAAGGQYLKISIGKGNLTVEELVDMIERYTKYI